MRYLFDIAERNLRECSARADGDISSTIAVKLTKGLMSHIVRMRSPASDSLQVVSQSVSLFGGVFLPHVIMKCIDLSHRRFLCSNTHNL